MVRSRRPLAALALALGALTTGTAARADDASVARAQHLFDEAIVLIKAGRYAEACPRLEESDKLDPGMGTEYRLAECYEGAGRLASAWTVFRAVADAAQRDGQGERAAVAIRRAADLAPRVPMLVIEVPAAANLPGLSVRIDGNPIPASEWAHKVPVDPGQHLIAARAPGRVGWVRSIAPVSGTTTVVVPMLGDGLAPLAAPPPPPDEIAKAAPPPPTQPGLSTPRIAALAAGGVGVAGLVLGTVFGLRAGSQWKSAQDDCKDRVNGELCSPAGIQLGKDASTSASLSTVGFVVGGAALLTGTILWFRFAPPRPLAAAANLAPALGLGPGTVRLQGSF
ncbi:MAG: tetratricopeptide repeat protein [Byssovorax sp.]